MKLDLTDEELIRIYLPIQPSYCFELLYKRYHQKILQQCLQLTRNALQAQDFSQDIFMKVFDKLGSFQERSRFSTWLYAIAHNYCRDQIQLAERLSTTGISAQLEMSLIDQTETVSTTEVVGRYSRALESLSHAEQLLLRLKYEQALSLNELASLFGLSVSAVKMRLKRSRDKMQCCYARQLAG